MKPILFFFIAIFFFNTIFSQTILLSVDGVKLGKFKGESLRQRAADKMDLSSFVMEMAVARDAATGRSSGRRQYQPVTIVKQSGAASPQFLQAAATNERLTRVVIEFYKLNANGEEQPYYVVTLEDATVSGFKQFTPVSVNEKSNSAGILFDEIKIVFRKITLESKDGKTMASDDWSIM